MLEAKELPVFLTYRGMRRLHNRLGFPEDAEQLLEKLRSDMSEGFLGAYNKGHYKNRSYIIDFTNSSTGIIVIKDDEKYKAVSAFKRDPLPILRGDERVRIRWVYTPKKENTVSPILTKTYKH